MITGTHAIIYSDDAEATRAFFRDVLQFPYVDAHGGWLIFKMPPADLGIHPTMEDGAGNGDHEIYLMCAPTSRRRTARLVRTETSHRLRSRNVTG